MRKRRVENLLAVVVLAELTGRPMHRYELGATLRAHGKERDTAVKLSSLYRVVENLERHGLVEPAGLNRNGSRPEHVVYRTTPSGRAEMVEWLQELLSSPQVERPPFVAALSVMMVLPPDVVIELLGTRLGRLETLIAEQRTELEEAAAQQVNRVFLTEDEFGLAMLQAEADWVAGFREELRAGSHPDIATWRAWHATPPPAFHGSASRARGEENQS